MNTTTDNNVTDDDYGDDVNPDNILLPDWINDLLPEPKEPTLVEYFRNKYVVITPDGHRIFSDDDLIVAYDYAVFYDRANAGSGGISLSDEIPEIKNNGKMGQLFLTVKGRSIFGMEDRERLNLIRYPYGVFQNFTAPAYKENPNDFYTAYRFVDTHPALWTRPTMERQFDAYEWNTQGIAMRLWHVPTRKNDGSIVHMMEAGGHVLPECHFTYHDLRLDVYADSYEKAIIDMAAKIDKFFNPDGTEKEDVEYEKSQLEVDLEERIADYHEQFGKDSTKEPEVQ